MLKQDPCVIVKTNLVLNVQRHELIYSRCAEVKRVTAKF